MDYQTKLDGVKIYIKADDIPTACKVYSENFEVSGEEAAAKVASIVDGMKGFAPMPEEQDAINSLAQFMLSVEKLADGADEFMAIRQAAHEINGKFMIIMAKRRKKLL